ncbi:MAG: prolyl oligopeptidase family serine peptidase [Pseudomonadota bacterium]
MSVDLRPSAEAPHDDPYEWLEEIEGSSALAWVDAQNTRTLSDFGGDAWHADSEILTRLFDRPDNIPFVTRRGTLLFNYWRDAANPRGIWRTTTEDSYRSPEPEWTVLLDLDDLARIENKDWIWGSAVTRPKTHDRAIVRLSLGGSDAVEMREFDLENRVFCDDGFVWPTSKGGACWLDRDTLLMMSSLGDNMATQSGYARAIRIWDRNAASGRSQAPDRLPVIAEVPPHYIALWASVVANRDQETLWFVALPSFFEREYSVGDRTGSQIKLDLPRDADAELRADHLLIQLRSSWQVDGITYPVGALLAIGFDAFVAGDRDFKVLFAPEPRRVLKGWTWAGDKLVLSILDSLQPVFQILSAGDWQLSQMSGLPGLGVVHVMRLDHELDESDGALLASAEDPLTPPTLMLRTPDAPAWDVLKQAPPGFAVDGLATSRHEAVSSDGERIPYVQIGPQGPATGDAPVHLFGYGGFEASILPSYRIGIGKLWLERGGTSVIANIRGGGEFGPEWHEAGRRAGKRLAHDDFAAVAADLVARGVTRPQRIAAEGGSNGGILISNMFVRYPERFGALFCTIPLIDMWRYSKLLAGASWIAEYGDPEIPEDWAYLQTYSAYHQVRAPSSDCIYPPMLLATTRRDDRVHPGHARKMAAKMQAIGHNAYFYEPAAGGHGYGKDNSERAAFTALGFRFLRAGIGWQD